MQVDSTAPHNRSLIKSHGEICDRVQSQVDQALGSATPGELVVLTLHHHLLPLPTETLAERFALGMGWPFASELVLGSELLRRARGRCDLVLHGHRHVPREVKPWPADLRPLTIYNAGSSTEMGGGRLFLHQEGRLLGSPEWLGVELPRRGRVGAAVPEPSFTPA